jgi:autotransporter-associated beta strand protein
MCAPTVIDVPTDTVQTQQIDASGFLTQVSVAGSLNVTDLDAILVPSGVLPVSFITNTGTITASGGKSGINNASTINKVVNGQGAGNPSGPLTYTGILPQRYEIIINSPTDYGVLNVNSVTTSSAGMAFGIYSGDIDGIDSSVLTETTYSSVLQGFANLSGVTGTSGTFGEDFNYELVQQDTTTNWDLLVTSTSLPEITTGNSVALSDVGVTVEPIFDGGTLLLANSDQSNLAFLVRSTGGIITAPETGSAELSGVLSGDGALTFNGDATTMITGTNTYSGGTTVSSGTLQGDATSLQGNIVNNGSVVFNQGGSGTYAGVISGTGGLTKDGSGTLTLSGVNTYTGTTTVSAGTLKLGVTNALAAGALDVQSGATFDLNNFAHAVTGLSGAGGISLDSATLTAGSTADTTFSGVISGTGGLTKVGTGTFTLTGANTYSGVTTVNDGVLKIGAAGSVPTGALSVGTDGTFDLNNFAQTVTDLTGAGEITLGSATLTAGSTADTTFSGVISGMGSLVKVGAGMLTLAGVNTYTGYTIVNQGILRIGVAGAQGLGELIIDPDGTVDFNGFDQTVTNLNGSGSLELNDANLTATSTENTTYAGVISGTGSFIKDGTATLALSGNNTYSGGTTVASGTLSVAGSSPTGTGSVTVEPGAVLSGRGTIQGQITVFGTLKPGNSPGYLQTTANVNLKTGSTYLQDIAGAAQANDSSAIGASGYYAYLNIQGGELRIASDTTLTPRLANLFSSGQPGYGSTPYTPLLGDRFRIITADKGIKGRFSELTQPKDLGPGTSLAVFYDIQGSNSVDLSVIPSSYTQTVASGSGNQNAVSVGAALDQISQRNQSATSTQTQDELLSATASQRSANAIANYAQRLSGEVYAANVAVSAQTTLRLHQTNTQPTWLGQPRGRIGDRSNRTTWTVNDSSNQVITNTKSRCHPTGVGKH